MVNFEALKNKLKEEVHLKQKTVEDALHELEREVKAAFGFAAPPMPEDLPAGGAPLKAEDVGLAKPEPTISARVKAIDQTPPSDNKICPAPGPNAVIPPYVAPVDDGIPVLTQKIGDKGAKE
jgi:hypothetical protein